MKYTAADAVIDAMDEAQRSGSTVQHVLAVKNAALRADLEALAVAALRERMSEWGFGNFEMWEAYTHRMDEAEVELWKALARPGVRKVLEGAKGGDAS